MEFFSLARGIVALPAVAFSFAVHSEAAVLSQWTFNDVTVNQSGVAVGTGASIFTRNNDFNGTVGPVANSTVSGVGGTGTYVFGGGNLKTTEAAALEATHTFNVTLTPDGGNTVSLSQLSFYAWGNTGVTAGTTSSFFVRSDQTGETTLGTFSSTIRLANTTSPSESSLYTLNLADVTALQNVSSAVTFTIGIYASAGGGNYRIDSLQLDGTVGTVPEPSALFPVAVGMGAAGFVRRRRLR